MTKQESALLAGSAKFIYLFKEIKTGKIIYVGQTRYLGRRLTEHRKGINDIKNHASIYLYMRENNLKLFTDVEVVIVDYTQDRQQAEKIEAELIDKYSDTVLNTVKYDTRKYNTDPRFKKVLCVDTGEIFWAVKPVLEKYNISRYFLDKAINNGTEIAGHIFKYIE